MLGSGIGQINSSMDTIESSDSAYLLSLIWSLFWSSRSGNMGIVSEEG